jgi:hypothetical protein
MIVSRLFAPAPASLPRRRLVLGLGALLAGCAEPYVRGGPVYETPAPPQRQPIATLDVQGEVVVVQGGREFMGYDGMPLFEGDHLRTRASSYALCRFRDGDSVWLDYDTHVGVGSIFTFFGRVFASVSGVFQVDSEFVAASSEGTEFTVTIARTQPQFSVAVRRGAVLCRPRRGRWRPVRLQTGERLIGLAAATPRVDRLDAREQESEFGWVPGSGPPFRFRVPDRSPSRPSLPPRERAPTPPRPPQDTTPPSTPEPTGPRVPRRPSGGIIERLEPAPTTPPPSEPVIR